MLRQVFQKTLLFLIIIIFSLSSCYDSKAPYENDSGIWLPIDTVQDGENNFDIEFLAEELPDSTDIGDILHLVGQIVNYGPDNYFGDLELGYTVLDTFPTSTIPIYIADNIATIDYLTIDNNGLFSQDSLNIDETIYFENNQSVVVTEEIFRKGQKNIIIIWPVDLMSDINSNNNFYFKEIYVRE
ncbi:MAG: hypothetical protein ACPG5B_12135 [Chitinophagales bacterium]